MEWSAGGDPNTATQYVIFRRFHPLLSMVRVQYVVAVDDNVMKIVPGATPPLRRLELVGSYQVQKDRDGILRALGDASFDAHKQVILERVPDPEPLASDNPGHATITREGTDFIDIEADLATPSLLLVTDSWAPEWRAKALPGSSQSSYELLPANYILRAIALHPGKHRLRLEYASLAFPLGAAVSVLAWTAWIVAICLLMQREKGSVRA
jgi:hypothetical protein